MALTMTRNRTQTTLTKLCLAIANCHGELEFVESLLSELRERPAAHRQRGAAEAAERYLASLSLRREQLLAAREALYVTLQVFDAQLSGERIAAANDWLKPFGRTASRAARQRYLRRLDDQPERALLLFRIDFA